MCEGSDEKPRVVVGVVLYNDNGEILLAKSHKWKDVWVIPGGGVEYGEQLEHAVQREHMKKRI